MKISTKTRYGLRFLIHVGNIYGKDEVVQLRDIAKKESISEKYLEQIASTLKLSGLIDSTRGAGGGYYLTRNPRDITLKDVFDALEGSTTAIDCTACDLRYKCVTTEVWEGLGRHINSYLNDQNLSDLVESYREKQGLHMYYI